VLDTKTKQNYKESIASFEHITNIAIKLSIETTGREVDSWREEYASYIFAKICLHAISLLKLQIRFTKSGATDISNVWDISSIAVLTRSIIDSYYVFYYLAVDECDMSELEFRRNLWEYHGEYQRLNMLNRIKSENPKVKDLEKYIEKLKKKIINNKFYKSISKTHLQQQIRKGNIAILLSNTELSKRAGINPDYYKSNFDYLSAYTHAYPFAHSQLKLFRANDNESLGLVTFIIDLCTGYVCHATADFINLFPDQERNLDRRSKILIDDWRYRFREINKPKK